jgi:hypothetical protein
VRKVLSALVLVVLACGKRGDPRPPIPVIPQATSDLVVTQRAGRVILSWSYPALTTAGRNLTNIQRISIHRYEEELPVAPGGRDPKTILPGDVDMSQPQPIALFSKVPTITQAQFAKLSNRIQSIEKANLGGATAGGRLVFTDTPPFRSTGGRPVRLTYAVVTEGENARSEPSNLAIIVPLPVGVPPPGVKATAKAEGVTVTWSAPQTSVGGVEGPIITGYNVYRTAPGTVPGDLDAPINTAPIVGTKYADTPGYGEHEYRVAAIATVGPPLMQSDLSAPARIDFRDLVPPPVPGSITPLIEQRAVRLIWDPVDAPDLAGYRVYRTEGTGHGDNIKDIGTVALVNEVVTATTISDPNADPGIAYRYGVASIDKSGNESARVWTEWVVVPKTP